MARRGHQKGKVATHQCCWGGTWYVQLEEDEMAKTLGNELGLFALIHNFPLTKSVFQWSDSQSVYRLLWCVCVCMCVCVCVCVCMCVCMCVCDMCVCVCVITSVCIIAKYVYLHRFGKVK